MVFGCVCLSEISEIWLIIIGLSKLHYSPPSSSSPSHHHRSPSLINQDHHFIHLIPWHCLSVCSCVASGVAVYFSLSFCLSLCLWWQKAFSLTMLTCEKQSVSTMLTMFTTRTESCQSSINYRQVQNRSALPRHSLHAVPMQHQTCSLASSPIDLGGKHMDQNECTFRSSDCW